MTRVSVCRSSYQFVLEADWTSRAGVSWRPRHHTLDIVRFWTGSRHDLSYRSMSGRLCKGEILIFRAFTALLIVPLSDLVHNT